MCCGCPSLPMRINAFTYCQHVMLDVLLGGQQSVNPLYAGLGEFLRPSSPLRTPAQVRIAVDGAAPDARAMVCVLRTAQAGVPCLGKGPRARRPGAFGDAWAGHRPARSQRGTAHGGAPGSPSAMSGGGERQKANEEYSRSSSSWAGGECAAPAAGMAIGRLWPPWLPALPSAAPPAATGSAAGRSGTCCPLSASLCVCRSPPPLTPASASKPAPPTPPETRSLSSCLTTG